MADDVGNIITQITSNTLLFILLAGMAASVDSDCLKDCFLKRWRGIAVGLLAQFVILPSVGLLSVKAFDLSSAYGIALLATTASPGGAYSNWWCSVMNADLALSIAMTTCSTVVSIGMMPINILVYTMLAYGESPELSMWRILFSIGIAVCAILTGTLVSAKLPGLRTKANLLGNGAGVVLIVFGALVSSSDEPLWNKEAKFYPAVALPCVVGLLLAFVTSYGFVAFGQLVQPEAVAVCVEVCYQNTGLALSIALASFEGDQRGDAAAVPLFYAICQVICLPTFLLVCWRCGWTYAPSSASICHILLNNYQPTAGSGTTKEKDDGKKEEVAETSMMSIDTAKCAEAVMEDGNACISPTLETKSPGFLRIRTPSSLFPNTSPRRGQAREDVDGNHTETPAHQAASVMSSPRSQVTEASLASGLTPKVFSLNCCGAQWGPRWQQQQLDKLASS